MIEHITLEWLKEKDACKSSLDYAVEKGWISPTINQTPKDAINLLMAEGRFSDANWLVTRLMTLIQCVEYAINAAELVLPIYESKYPEDDRPRKAIEAVKKYLDDPTEENADAAARVADADYTAFHAADAFYAVAYAARAAYAAFHATYAFHAAARAARANIELKGEIINKGLEILYREVKNG